MDFRLAEQGLHREFDVAVAGCRCCLCIVTPSFQVLTVEQLLVNQSLEVMVITCFSQDEFHGGVNSLNALCRLIDVGAKIKGVRNLYAKAYLFDDSLAVVRFARRSAKSISSVQP